jgi:hypothetical protein
MVRLRACQRLVAGVLVGGCGSGGLLISRLKASISSTRLAHALASRTTRVSAPAGLPALDRAGPPR